MVSDEDRSDRELFELARGIRDLSDFCERWPEIRDSMPDIPVARKSLKPGQQEVVKWMLLLTDRVCLSKEI